MKQRMLALALGLGLLGTGSAFAMVQNAPAPTPMPTATMAHHQHAWHGHGRHGDRGFRGGHERRHAHGPVMSVIGTLGKLERLYRMEGRRSDIETLYRGVLKRTDNPMVRHFAYDRLARNEMHPGATAKAIATLRQSLDESLKQLDQADARHAARKAGR